MPFIERDDARIHWYEIGRGEPIVMIMGLGCSSAMWFRLAPQLARSHRVILLDNRGCGQTEVKTKVTSFVSHRITAMAEDVVAVLDAAGESTAHVLGFSMGGMIAQQLTIDHPSRVRTLTLLATHCGSAHAVLAEPKVTNLLFAKGAMTPEQSFYVMAPHVYAKDTPDHVIAEDAAVRLATYPSLRDYQGQLVGLLYWSSYAQLRRIRVETLVLHGLEDQLIPPANGRMLAERIPHARLIELPKASHWALTDQTEAVAGAVQGFVAANSRGPFSPLRSPTRA